MTIDIIRKALTHYIEEKVDILIAVTRVVKNEDTISLDEIKKKYDLE